MKPLRVKICGMQAPDNLLHIATLEPDFLGFIFVPSSPRYVQLETLPSLPPTIQKVGVFVNATHEVILQKVEQYKLDFIQLHGDESPEDCEVLALRGIKIIKAFRLHPNFDFSVTEAYEPYCEYFLWDTYKPKAYGGTGQSFDWHLLRKYSGSKSYFIGGGIGLHNLHTLLPHLTEACFAIDLNSQIEQKPGLKDVALAKKCIEIVKAYVKT